MSLYSAPHPKAEALGALKLSGLTQLRNDTRLVNGLTRKGFEPPKLTPMPLHHAASAEGKVQKNLEKRPWEFMGPGKL